MMSLYALTTWIWKFRSCLRYTSASASSGWFSRWDQKADKREKKNESLLSNPGSGISNGRKCQGCSELCFKNAEGCFKQGWAFSPCPLCESPLAVIIPSF